MNEDSFSPNGQDTGDVTGSESSVPAVSTEPSSEQKILYDNSGYEPFIVNREYQFIPLDYKYDSLENFIDKHLNDGEVG